MEAYINDHLRMDSKCRVLFYPADFTSPGYLVPTERLRKRIIWMYRLYRFFCYLVSVPIGFGVLYCGARLDSMGIRQVGEIAYVAGVAGYFLLYRPLEALWRWYATELAARLEKVHD